MAWKLSEDLSMTGCSAWTSLKSWNKKKKALIIINNYVQSLNVKSFHLLQQNKAHTSMQLKY